MHVTAFSKKDLAKRTTSFISMNNIDHHQPLTCQQRCPTTHSFNVLSTLTLVYVIVTAFSKYAEAKNISFINLNTLFFVNIDRLTWQRCSMTHSSDYLCAMISYHLSPYGRFKIDALMIVLSFFSLSVLFVSLCSLLVFSW